MIGGLLIGAYGVPVTYYSMSIVSAFTALFLLTAQKVNKSQKTDRISQAKMIDTQASSFSQRKSGSREIDRGSRGNRRQIRRARGDK